MIRLFLTTLAIAYIRSMGFRWFLAGVVIAACLALIYCSQKPTENASPVLPRVDTGTYFRPCVPPECWPDIKPPGRP